MMDSTEVLLRKDGDVLPFIADGRQCSECSRIARHAIVTNVSGLRYEPKYICNVHFAADRVMLLDKEEETKTCEHCGSRSEQLVSYPRLRSMISEHIPRICSCCRNRLDAGFEESEDNEDNEDDTDYLDDY